MKIEEKEYYPLYQSLMRISGLQDKQGLAMNIAEAIYNLGYKVPSVDEAMRAVRAERRKIAETMVLYLHQHNGEWCFTPEEFVRFMDYLEEGK